MICLGCWEEIGDKVAVYTKPCKHIFCNKCAEGSLKQQMICPFCQSVLPKDGIAQLNVNPDQSDLNDIAAKFYGLNSTHISSILQRGLDFWTLQHNNNILKQTHDANNLRKKLDQANQQHSVLAKTIAEQRLKETELQTENDSLKRSLSEMTEKYAEKSQALAKCKDMYDQLQGVHNKVEEDLRGARNEKQAGYKDLIAGAPNQGSGDDEIRPSCSGIRQLKDHERMYENESNGGREKQREKERNVDEIHKREQERGRDSGRESDREHRRDKDYAHCRVDDRYRERERERERDQVQPLVSAAEHSDFQSKSDRKQERTEREREKDRERNYEREREREHRQGHERVRDRVRALVRAREHESGRVQERGQQRESDDRWSLEREENLGHDRKERSFNRRRGQRLMRRESIEEQRLNSQNSRTKEHDLTRRLDQGQNRRVEITETNRRYVNREAVSVARPDGKEDDDNDEIDDVRNNRADDEPGAHYVERHASQQEPLRRQERSMSTSARRMSDDNQVFFRNTDDRDVSQPSLPLRMRVASGGTRQNRTTTRRSDPPRSGDTAGRSGVGSERRRDRNQGHNRARDIRNLGVNNKTEFRFSKLPRGSGGR